MALTSGKPVLLAELGIGLRACIAGAGLVPGTALTFAKLVLLAELGVGLRASIAGAGFGPETARAGFNKLVFTVELEIDLCVSVIGPRESIAKTSSAKKIAPKNNIVFMFPPYFKLPLLHY
ncbi:hypothetical protein FACS189449_10440 [Alphaproteobacteria bacterium]|nr:hypothetical protein FACS189449_10440 [Alphaproteobacteria bacterium]